MRLHDVDFTTSEIMRRPYDYIIQELPAHNVGTIHFGRRWIVHKGWALGRFFDCFTFLSALGGVNEIPHAMGVFKTNHEAYQLTQKLNSEIVKNEEPETWAICKYTWQDVYKQTHKSK